MARDRRRAPAVTGAVAAALAATAAVVPGCAHEQRPVRIGVLVDCLGINRSLGDAERAAATLPLVERGAPARARSVAGGAGPVRIAGRRVELRRGCTEVLEFSTLIAEARRLVEREHVDVVVGGGSGPDEIVVREVARRYPRVTFIPVVHGPREVTLHRPAPNVLRVVADHAQGVAGLGSYARTVLGWRRAAVVFANWDAGWGGRDAFVAEFCAAGGRVVRQVPVDFFDPAGRDARRVPAIPRGADGVLVLAPQFFGPEGFLRRIARQVGAPRRRLLVGPGVTDEPGLLRATSRALAGVVGSSARDPSRLRAYLRALTRGFPGVSPTVAGGELVSGYRDAVEAVLVGLQRAGGQPAQLRTALSRGRLDLLSGAVRVDRRGQAVVATTLARIGAASDGTPVLRTVRRITGVDQSVGGFLPPMLTPSDRPSACRAGRSRRPWHP